MARKPPRLLHVRHVKARGRWYSYFNTGRKVDGKAVYVRLPDWGTTGFHDSYASLLGHRAKKPQRALTITGLIQRYEQSPQWQRLSKGSQRVYANSLRKVREALGEAPITEVERQDVKMALAQYVEGNASKAMFAKVLSALYVFAIDEDLAKTNPAAGFKFAKGTPYEPWPEPLLHEALSSDERVIRLSVHLMYFTGQRIGDVCAMRWGDIRDGAIFVRQQKTAKALHIPLHSDLAGELTQTPRKGLTILAHDDGRPLDQKWLRLRVKAWLAARNEPQLVPHGLRKNAVNALLLSGCTIAETGAITGQSYAVVEHYARGIDQRRLGEAAILKLERKAEKSA